jgi:hypothetical protein
VSTLDAYGDIGEFNLAVAYASKRAALARTDPISVEELHTGWRLDPDDSLAQPEPGAVDDATDPGHGWLHAAAHEEPWNASTKADLITARLTRPAIPFGLRVVRADAVSLTRVRYLWDGRIPLRAVTLMPGEEGIGKTTVGVRLIADLTQGTLPGEFYGVPRAVVVLALEDGLEDVYAPRLTQAGANLSRVHVVRCALSEDGSEAPVILPRDLGVVGELVRDVNAALVWTDSLVTTLPDEMKTISYKDTAKVLQALNKWAESEDVSVVAPWHLNKAHGSSTAMRIMDSRAFRTAVRSMLLVVRDPDAPEGVTQGLVMLDKANGGSLAVPALRYRIRSASYVVDEIDAATGEVQEVPAACGVVDWMGYVSAADAREAADRSLAPQVERDDKPLEFLRDLLNERGRTLRQDVLGAAKAAGFSESGMKRAARRLCVHSTEERGQQADGRPFRRSWWELPGPGEVTTLPASQGGQSDE